MTRYSQHTITAQGLVGDTIVPLKVKAATIVLDESWTPYAQGDLVCSIPANVEALDPRNDVRLSIVVYERLGVGGILADFDTDWGPGTLADNDTDWANTGTLADITAAHFTPWNSAETEGSSIVLNVALRARRIDHLAAELTLTFASDEALIQDYALMVSSMTAGSTSVRDACNMVLSQIGGVLEAGTADATVTEADALIWATGESGDSFLAPLLELGNLRLWCDEQRRWRLDDRDMTLEAVTVLNEFTAALDTIDRGSDNWYDGIVIEYWWTNPTTGTTTIRRDIAGRAGASRVLTLRHERPFPGAGAAALMLDRVNRRGRVLDLTGVSDYSVRPSNELTALPPDTAAQTGTVEAVTFTWPGDEMTVRSRGLIDTSPAAWLLRPSGVSWLANPAGVSWLDAPIGV